MKPAKTAGTTILRHIIEKEISSIIHFRDHPAEFSKWLSEITDSDLDDYYIWTVLRNPWDRFISLAAYFKVPPKTLLKEFDTYLSNEDFFLHSLPLHNYCYNNGHKFTDFECKMENLTSDFNIVRRHIGLPEISLPVTNRTKHKHYSTYFDEEQLNLFEKIYAQDIELFDYQFAPPQPTKRFFSLKRQTTRTT